MLTPYELNRVKEAAIAEIRDEQFKEAVIREKERLRSKRWWHRLIPFTINIAWRNK